MERWGHDKRFTSDAAPRRNLAIGIGIQNFPEGLAVSLPLHRAGFSKWKAFWYGQMSGMVEPVAGVLGAGLVTVRRVAFASCHKSGRCGCRPLSSGSRPARHTWCKSWPTSRLTVWLWPLLTGPPLQYMEPVLPYALSFAAGAMVFVVFDDIIPEVCSGFVSSRLKHPPSRAMVP